MFTFFFSFFFVFFLFVVGWKNFFLLNQLIMARVAVRFFLKNIKNCEYQNNLFFEIM